MTKLGENQVNAFNGLLRPPVLSTEDENSFEEMLDKVTECVAPHNMIEWMYVRQYVCAFWFIERYMRHATLAIERYAAQQRASERARGAVAEREHNAALRSSIPFQEQLHALIVQQMAIRNDALQQLELYRAGLGQLTKQVTAKTIDAECEEISEPRLTDAPSIVHARESTEHDLPATDRSESAQ